MSNFVSYADATALMQKIADRINKLGAVTFKGSVAFSGLPATPDSTMIGWMYNVNEDFTTDARFVEGAGKKYKAGENVIVDDLSTYAAATPVGSENPSTEGWYELVNGKYVESTDTTVDPLKTYYVKTPVYKLDCAGQLVDIDAILDIICQADFDATQAYEIGDVVKKDEKLYRFKAAHTANDPWDPTEVDEVDVIELIKDAEPDSLTQQQLEDLIALLG